MTAAGVIHGGWRFVIAAYSISVLVLLGYAVSIHIRYRAERARRHREAAGVEAGS
jgi:hypothetical protein